MQSILVIHDLDGLLNVIHSALADDYDVFKANSPEEAEALCRQVPMELAIIAGTCIGGVQCNELAEKLLSINPELKLLYMSSYDKPSLVQEGKLKKEDHFLKKPFGLPQLEGAVREIFAN